MPIVPTVDDERFTVSDILAPGRWPSSGPRAGLGLEVACTKVSVDFQMLDPATADDVIRRDLDVLREAAGTDVAFLALFDADSKSCQQVEVAKGLFAQCSPEALRGELLDGLPWLRDRLGHARVIEIRDTEQPRRELAQ